MKFSRPFFSMFLIFVFSFTVIPQSGNMKPDWYKFKVFTHTREDVEKIYGEGKDFGLGKIYYIPKVSIIVDYKDYKGCTSRYSTWDVDKNVVVEINYSFEEAYLKLKDILPNKKGFRKKIHGTGDVPDHIELYDDEKGISIIYDKKDKSILNLIIRPSNADKLKHSCDRFED